MSTASTLLSPSIPIHTKKPVPMDQRSGIDVKIRRVSPPPGMDGMLFSSIGPEVYFGREAKDRSGDSATGDDAAGR